jgi:hypothetical protein
METLDEMLVSISTQGYDQGPTERNISRRASEINRPYGTHFAFDCTIQSHQ